MCSITISMYIPSVTDSHSISHPHITRVTFNQDINHIHIHVSHSSKALVTCTMLHILTRHHINTYSIVSADSSQLIHTHSCTPLHIHLYIFMHTSTSINIQTIMYTTVSTTLYKLQCMTHTSFTLTTLSVHTGQTTQQHFTELR